MREIKFRAWNKRIGWRNKDGSDCEPVMEHRGWVMYPDTGRCTFPESGWDINGPEEDPENFILMQYTGLKDKNGVEIYEGDMFQVIGGNGFQMMQGKVYFEEGSFRIKYGYQSPEGKQRKDYFLSSAISEHTARKIEVIGNIYENPELIK